MSVGWVRIKLCHTSHHTQLVDVRSPWELVVVGTTLDDAAGEAFDKVAKMIGLPYPGGPHVDRLAKEGNPAAFAFAAPRMDGLDFSFSGLKTSVLRTLERDGREAMIVCQAPYRALPGAIDELSVALNGQDSEGGGLHTPYKGCPRDSVAKGRYPREKNTRTSNLGKG